MTALTGFHAHTEKREAGKKHVSICFGLHSPFARGTIVRRFFAWKCPSRDSVLTAAEM